MTVLNAVETTKRLFPDISEKEILDRFNAAQRLYASLTRCLVAWVDEHSMTTAWYQLDERFVDRLTGIFFLDTNSKLLDPEDLGVYYQVVDRHIVFTDEDGIELATWPSEIAVLRLRTRDVPSTVSTVSSIFTIDERFHEFLLNKVLGDLYLIHPQIPNAIHLQREHLQGWARGLIEGKRYANIAADELNGYSVRFASYAGG